MWCLAPTMVPQPRGGGVCVLSCICYHYPWCCRADALNASGTPGVETFPERGFLFTPGSIFAQQKLVLAGFIACSWFLLGSVSWQLHEAACQTGSYNPSQLLRGLFTPAGLDISFLEAGELSWALPDSSSLLGGSKIHLERRSQRRVSLLPGRCGITLPCAG